MYSYSMGFVLVILDTDENIWIVQTVPITRAICKLSGELFQIILSNSGIYFCRYSIEVTKNFKIQLPHSILNSFTYSFYYFSLKVDFISAMQYKYYQVLKIPMTEWWDMIQLVVNLQPITAGLVFWLWHIGRSSSWHAMLHYLIQKYSGHKPY